MGRFLVMTGVGWRVIRPTICAHARVVALGVREKRRDSDQGEYSNKASQHTRIQLKHSAIARACLNRFRKRVRRAGRQRFNAAYFADN
jgi:hypothetical protein